MENLARGAVAAKPGRLTPVPGVSAETPPVIDRPRAWADDCRGRGGGTGRGLAADPDTGAVYGR